MLAHVVTSARDIEVADPTQDAAMELECVFPRLGSRRSLLPLVPKDRGKTWGQK